MNSYILTEDRESIMTTEEVVEVEEGVCDHNWEYVDDSFSHEFGLERVEYYQCSKCETTKDYHYESGDIDDDRL